MQPVDLNLATRPFKNDTLPWVGFLLGLLLVGYTSWWNLSEYFARRAEIAGQEQSRSNMQHRMNELDRRDGDAVKRIEGYNLPVLSVKSDKANEVIRWKSFSWTRLFNLLQEVQPYNVQMTSIHPVFSGAGTRARGRGSVSDAELVTVSVEGVAKRLVDFLEFERALIHSPHFDRPEPDRHTVDELTKEVVFRMSFLYDPRVSEELEDVAPEEAQEAQEAQDEQGEAALVAREQRAPADATGAVIEPSPEGFAGEPGSVPEPEGVLASEGLQRIPRGAPEATPIERPSVATAPATPPRTRSVTDRRSRRGPTGAIPVDPQPAAPLERAEPWQGLAPVALGDGTSDDEREERGR